MTTDLQAAVSIVTLVLGLFSSTGYFYLWLKGRNEHRKDRDALAIVRVQSDIERDKRQDEKDTLFIGAISTMQRGFDRYGDKLEELSNTLKAETALQEKTLHYREQQSDLDRDQRDKENKAHIAALHEQASTIADLALGFKAGLENIGATIATAGQDGIAEISQKLNAITSHIEQTSTQGVQSISEKINNMSEELTNKLNPIDERLTHVANTLTEIKEIVKALPDQAAINQVNRQLEELNRQLSDLRHTLAVDRAGGNTAQTDADHATNVAADKAAFDGPTVDPLAAPKPKPPTEGPTAP